MTQTPMKIAVGWTGASGLQYGVQLVGQLLALGQEVHLVYTQAAQIVAKQELQITLPSQPEKAKTALINQFEWQKYASQLNIFTIQDWFAPLASGTGQIDALVICPCTMGTLASIAHGLSDDLLSRGADVMLKERKKLILAPREMPFSALHLENMLKLAQWGAIIMPPNPGFYQHPQTIADLIDFVVARILDQLGLKQTLLPAWGRLSPMSDSLT